MNRVTGGAQSLFLSVPAASTSIKHLEEGLCATLLLRTCQGMTLTPPGQAFARLARRVLGQLEHRRGELQECAKGIKDHPRVWTGATAMGEVPATRPPKRRAEMARKAAAFGRNGSRQAWLPASTSSKVSNSLTPGFHRRKPN